MARVLFDQVWKRFRRGPAHDSLRDLIPAVTKRMLGRGPSKEELGATDFWAVKDVSFEVKPGEALGIIGGNGAGKSTTLKLLTRILKPTLGTALIEGRFGSLIEVSAGFHQDLTGRENIFLQGAIMGMPQQLIKERFDEIVEFSGISAFIDTPVKRYSSGMNARLGFSIAVHLEPDVLIVDEVLSVGDAEFQSRAFERIKGLVQSNIPVVIVSHQLERILELCTKTVLLAKGEVTATGTAQAVIKQYQMDLGSGTSEHSPVVDGLQLHTLTPAQSGQVHSGESLDFVLTGSLKVEFPPWLSVLFRVRTATTNTMLYQTGHRPHWNLNTDLGDFSDRIRISANLAPGSYLMESLIWDGNTETLHHGPSTYFEVAEGANFKGIAQLSLRAAENPNG